MRTDRTRPSPNRGDTGTRPMEPGAGDRRPILHPTRMTAPSTDTYVFNRKRVNRPDDLAAQAIAAYRERSRSNGRFLRVLDFNTGNATLASMNIVPPDRADLPRAYEALTPSEREALVFEPFLNQILAAATETNSDRIIHVDHHYDHPALSATSTTVMLLDFVLWLHDRRTANVLNFTDFHTAIEALSHSYGVLDHSDADIVLAHFVATQAGDEQLLRKHAYLFRSTALFNDYLIETETDSKRSAEVQIFFNLARAIEQRIAAGELKLEEAFAELSTALRLLPKLDSLLADHTGALDAALFARISVPETLAWNENADLLNELTPAEREVLADFHRGALSSAQQMRVVEGLPVKAIRSATEAEEGGIYQLGKLLVVHTPPTALAIESSSVLRHFLQTSSPLLEGASMILVITTSPATKAKFIKVRSLDERLDLNPLYSAWRAAGLDAGGRARAGSAAYGKSGRQGGDAASLLADLAVIAREFESVLGSRT